jgi:hypothetical protein
MGNTRFQCFLSSITCRGKIATPREANFRNPSTEINRLTLEQPKASEGVSDTKGKVFFETFVCSATKVTVSQLAMLFGNRFYITGRLLNSFVSSFGTHAMCKVFGSRWLSIDNVTIFIWS